MLLLFSPLFVFCSSSKFQYQTVKAGNKNRFFKALLLFATLLSCVSFSECYYIYTFSGTGVGGYSGDGGPATSAELNNPNGFAVYSTGEVYFCDKIAGDGGNQRVRLVHINSTINTFAGNGSGGYYGDRGPATNAELSNPIGITVSSTGEAFIADNQNARIRMVFANKTITTVAGNRIWGYSGDGGLAINAEINQAGFTAILPTTGAIFFAEYGNNKIRILVDSPSAECSYQGYYQNQSYCICGSGYTGELC